MVHDEQSFPASSSPALPPPRVVVYYCNRTALGLRCFRLALILHYNLLQISEHCIDEPKADVAGTSEGDEVKRVLYARARDYGETPDVQAAEAAAAAIVLNNIGVCLAGVRDAGSAVRALGIASSITT